MDEQFVDDFDGADITEVDQHVDARGEQSLDAQPCGHGPPV